VKLVGGDFGRAQALSAQQRYDEALNLLLKSSEPKTATYLYWLGSFYAGAGNKDKALAALEKSLDLGFEDFPAINANSSFKSLHDDPRFQQLMHLSNEPQ